jgi:LacI family transcriptional regulator
MEGIKKKRPTLADIARAANVSLMTVSRAVNDQPGVGAAMRQRILLLAEQLGYQPNQIARSLATSRTGTIGLVVPDNTNPFFAQIARGVEDAAYERSYNVFLLNTAENPEREAAAIDSLWQKDVDGLIWCSSRLPLSALEIQVERFPAVVLFNRELGRLLPGVVTLNVQDRRGAQAAVAHFLAQGRRKIACVHGPANSLSARRRLEGYQQALSAAGVPLDPQWQIGCTPDTDGGRAAAADLLHLQPGIQAVLAFNDLVAVGVLQACQEAGYRVPQDVAVIGFDDIPLARMVRPQLTTLHVDLENIGRLAMSSLLNLRQGSGSGTEMLIEPVLVRRESA